jgi:MFS family permease
MTNQYTTTGLQAILSFPFKDPAWKQKLLVGSLLGFAGFIVPVLPWLFLAGYFALIIRRITVEEGDPYLPEWEDWTHLLEEGVRLAAVAFVYYLPFILLMLITFGVFFVPMFGLIAADSTGQQIPSEAFWLPFVSQFAGMGLMGVAMLVGIVAHIFMQPAICHAVSKRQFADGFHFSEWWPVFRANLGGFILAFVLFTALSYGAMLLFQIIYMTIILCLLLPFFMGAYYFYFGMLGSVLFAEAYRIGQERSAQRRASASPGQPAAI